MQLKLLRLKLSATCTMGELWIDNAFFCYTLERPSTKITDAQAPYCIPTGTYVVTPRWSNHNNMNVLGVNNVPGRTDIEVHPANWPSQLLGCIAVGDISSDGYVGDSRLTFTKLMEKTDGQSLSLTICEPTA